MRVFLKKIGNLILTLPGLPWPFSLIAATLKTSRIYTSMDPVCAKLQDFLQCGYLSREHIFYKLIKNAVDFVTAVNNDFSKENQFEWDSEIFEFLDSIEHYGHEATVNLLRGPGFYKRAVDNAVKTTAMPKFN